jgi:hypothetical protein
MIGPRLWSKSKKRPGPNHDAKLRIRGSYPFKGPVSGQVTEFKTIMSQLETAAENKSADGVAFIEGDYMPIGEARIPITDWGFLRSDVTYDVVAVWGGGFFRLEDLLIGSFALSENCTCNRPMSAPK